MEDLNGKFEVPLFNKDFVQYYPVLAIGKVYYIVGNKSNFNGNEDGILRVLPQAVIAFEDIARLLKGEVKVMLNHEQLKKGYLNELGSAVKNIQGNFKLLTQIQTEDLNYYQLESRRTFFPENGFISWLEKERIDFQIRIVTNGKNA
jgi:hypothetical protein